MYTHFNIIIIIYALLDDLSIAAAVLITVHNISRADDSHRKAINYYLFDEYHLWLVIYTRAFSRSSVRIYASQTRLSRSCTPITYSIYIYRYMCVCKGIYEIRHPHVGRWIIITIIDTRIGAFFRRLVPSKVSEPSSPAPDLCVGRRKLTILV